MNSIYNMLNRLKAIIIRLLNSNDMPAALNQIEQNQIKYSKKRFTYKTELQIVYKDNQVLCSDFVKQDDYYYTIGQEDKTNELYFYTDYKPVEDFIAESYSNGHMPTFDKSNKYHTSVPTQEIKKILYKAPIITVELLEENQ